MAKNKKPTVVVRPRKAKKQQKQATSVGLLGNALRALGGLGGAAVGGMFGQAGAGSSAGRDLGASISRWLGAGDYTVASNSIVKQTLKASGSIPMMHNEGQSVTIRHKEFIAELKGTTTFSVQRFFILQPGDTYTFPWLSTLATKFSQYRIKGMVFHYVPTSGSVSGTNPAIGSVMLQTSYRANDTAPTDKVEMLNEYWASEAAPNEAFVHPIECAPKENPFSVHYIRTQSVPSNDSVLMYDYGTTWVATSGMPADGNVVGDLFVTYEIELLKPVVKTNTSAEVVSVTGAFGGPTTTNLFGVTANLGLPFGIRTINFQSNSVIFPIGTRGTFLIYARVFSATGFTAFDFGTGLSYTNCSSYDLENPTSLVPLVRGTQTTAGTGLTYHGLIIVGVTITTTNTIATVVLPTPTWTGTASTTLFRLMEV